MATVAIMVGGAVLNAATFIGGNYLAKYLSGDSGQAALDEKKRHDLALEKYQRDYAQYQEDRTQLLDWVAEQDREKNKAFQDFQDTDAALALYNQTHRAKVAMPKEPQFSDYYKPARSRRMASCSSSAPAPWPLDMPPFASCERTHISIQHTRVLHAWMPNYRRFTTAPRGIGKGWPPSKNWRPLPRSLKM